MADKNYRVFNLRNRMGKSQIQMAKYLEISKSAYWERENGVQEFKESEMIKLAELFGETLDYLFMEDREVKTNA